MIDCLLAAPDLAIEPELVSRAADFDLRILRRCLDAADLLAACAVEPQLPIILTPGLPRLTRDLVSRLSADRLLVGIAEDQRRAQQLLSLGIDTCVLTRSPEHTLLDICGVLHGGMPSQISSPHQGVWSTGTWNAPTPSPPSTVLSHGHGRSQALGSVLSVWGAPGSPGRTTATLMLGRLLAAEGKSVCLIDADTTAPSLLQLCGIAESASSLVVACRFAERDSLDVGRMTQTAIGIDGRLFALGGIGHSDQWGDVRAPALSAVIKICRLAYDITIIDVGFGLERRHAVDLMTRRRFEAATSAVDDADALLAVVQSTPLGLSRYLNHRPSSGGRNPNAAGAVVPSNPGSSTAAGVASLRGYGIDLPVFELPRYSADEVVDARSRTLRRKRRFGRAPGIVALREWIAQLPADGSLNYGEGSTTTAVPT